MSSRELVCEHADEVERFARAGTGERFSLKIPAGITVEQRTQLFDHGQAVVDELRRRGHRTQTGVLRDQPDVEYYAIQIES